MSWQDLFSTRASRRTFLRGGALGTAAAAFPLALQTGPQASAASAAGAAFEPLPASDADELRVARGHEHQVILRWGDDIGAGAFGNDPDFTAFMPIDLLAYPADLSRPHAAWAPRGASSADGLLVVNHEFLDPRFVHGTSWRERSEAQKLRERCEVGVSVTRIVHTGDRWQVATDRRLNRRCDASTKMLLTGPARDLDGGPVVVGTLANCSGGITPWGTVLSCEENFQDYLEGGLEWDPAIYGRRHYGWIVEIDPYDPAAMPRKHTALGRFRHENVAIRVAADHTVVAYMGDDKRDSCVYKFVADRKLTANRRANLGIFESGRLYAADFAHGRWILLPSSAEALADARRTALDAGATPVDRPEDLEIDPADGSILVALTNNALHGNFYGHIVRLVERNANPAGTDFEWSVFATGGPQSGFSCPDNLLFDDHGNLWMCTDVSGDSIGRGIQSFLGNNSIFMLPRDYEGGRVIRFASGPVGCELTGPSWTPDGKTMFVSVQHPGGNSGNLDTDGPSSHWPEGGDAMPRGAVVAISGFTGNPA